MSPNGRGYSNPEKESAEAWMSGRRYHERTEKVWRIGGEPRLRGADYLRSLRPYLNHGDNLLFAFIKNCVVVEIQPPQAVIHVPARLGWY
jgi:hypothetical protein